MTNAIPPEVISALPPSWQVYAGAISAILVAIAAIGRAWQAWHTDSGIVKALVLGVHTPNVKQAPAPTTGVPPAP